MSVPGPNLEQIEYWNGRTGDRWAAQQEALDRALGPLGEAALARAAPAAGERVLDVGCGCGDTTITLARRVGAAGHVRGIDVSAQMLARARARTAGGVPGGAPIALEQVDAATLAPTRDRDLVFSRFGVMFFADPVAAFAALRGAARPQGRLTFVCWRPLAENPWARIPSDALAPFVAAEAPADPEAPGPFAFADPARVEGILRAAGWREIAIEPHDRELAWTATPSVDDAVALFTQIGPSSRRLAEVPDEERARGLTALRAALGPYVSASGLRLPGAVWLVSARGPDR